jgi:manganese transport system ATP-binding protein
MSLASVTVRRGDVLALDDINLTTRTGTVDALVGMNGAGKSTLFAAMMGLVPLTRGTLTVFGDTPARARAAGRIAFMPQGDAIDPDFPLTVADVVMMGRYGKLGITRRPRAADRRAVAESLDRVQLTDLAQRSIGTLSGGQRKRALMARALAQEADVLLLDEPFAGVDQRSEHLIAGVLTQLAAEGRSIVISTHDIASLPDRADRVILLAQRLITVDTPTVALAPAMLARAFTANRVEHS